MTSTRESTQTAQLGERLTLRRLIAENFDEADTVTVLRAIKRQW
jgi:hypothetical protein